jgi:hypothetical protein
VYSNVKILLLCFAKFVLVVILQLLGLADPITVGQ